MPSRSLLAANNTKYKLLLYELERPSDECIAHERCKHEFHSLTGTLSARAGLFDLNGRCLATHSSVIAVYEDSAHDTYEQSSDDIWGNVCYCINVILESTAVPADQVAAIGFDATCSLVVVDPDWQPVTVSHRGDRYQNVIMWLDHRAASQAEAINATNHRMLRAVGGKISLEMELPKVLWLKQNLPKSYAAAGMFFDLPDFLTAKATGSTARSMCSLSSKFGYDAETMSWPDDFLAECGLPDLAGAAGKARIGTDVRAPGGCIGPLTPPAANEMGLTCKTVVSVSLIDAYAGVLGVHGAGSDDLTGRLSIVAGTSSCYMALSQAPLYIPGVWGPYKNAILQGYWLTEAGQSASGSLIDHVIRNHAAYNESLDAARHRGQSLPEFLNGQVLRLAEERGLGHYAYLTRDVHVLPYHHGNRSPLADPSLTGAISGLRLSSSLDDLAVIYLATLQSVALGAKHIADVLVAGGHRFNDAMMTGGLAKNALVVEAHADCMGLPVRLSEVADSVLLGSAVGAAAAAGLYPDMQAAMRGMSRVRATVMPNQDPAVIDFYQRKFKVFRKMHSDWLSYREIMTAT